MRIKAIALNTFKEAVRNKIYYLLVFFGIIFILLSRLISILTIGDTAKVIKDVGLASIHFFTILVAIFTGINLVYKEIEKKTIYNIISKPISRSTFILGKFFGLAFTLLVALLSMGLIFSLYILVFIGSLDPLILVYFLYLYMELLIVTAISIVFSSFSTPILSSIFTLCLYIIGQVIWTYNLFKSKIPSPLAKFVADLVYHLMPNFHKFNIKNELVLNLKPELNLWSTLGYAGVYICALLALSIVIFSKKELK